MNVVKPRTTSLATICSDISVGAELTLDGVDMIEVSTRGGTRTRMPFRAKAFEASVSTIPSPGQDNTIKRKLKETKKKKKKRKIRHEIKRKESRGEEEK
jgi:coenzyme F420-reducing hydrogenase beta subunit